MTIEVPIKDHLVGTVSYARKKGLPNYSSEDAFFALQFEVGYDDHPELIAKKASEAFSIVQAQVNAELGLVPESIERAFPGAVIENNVLGQGIEVQATSDTVMQNATVTTIPTPAAQLAAAVAPEPSTGVGPNPPHGGDFKSWSPQQKKENAEWAKARLASHPGEFYDNTQDKRNPKAPDYKHKTSGIGVWL